MPGSGLLTGTTVVTVSFKNTKTAKTTAKKYRCVVKAAIEEAKLAINDVVATNATTLTVSGTKLGDLTATDVTVDGNIVSSYTAAADGKSATIVLGTALVPDSTTNVTINGTTFAVKYAAIVAAAVELTTTTFDNDTANQQMKLKVNGVEMTISELYSNGYETKFYGYENMSIGSNHKTAYFFNKVETGLPYNYSPDGVVSGGPINLGTYYVKAVVVKAGVTLESAVTEVTVLDLDTQTTGVNKVKFADNAGKFVVESTGTLNLVQGETVNIASLNITNGGKKYDVTPNASTAALKSSNTSVLTVTDHDTIVARAAGTSTLTVTYGENSIAIAVTVDKNARAFATIKADGGNASSIIKGETATLKFYAVDDHGAVMTDSAKVGIFAKVSNNVHVVDIDTVDPVVSTADAKGAAVTATTGEFKLYVKATDAGSTTIQFFQANSAFSDKVVGASSKLNISISVVNASVTTYGLVSDPIDWPLYLQDKTVSTVDMNTLNARSQHLVLKNVVYKNAVATVNTVSFGGISTSPAIKIFYDDSIITVSGAATKSVVTSGAVAVTNGGVISDRNIAYLDIVGKKTGSTTIVIKLGDTPISSYTVTVTNTTPAIGSITPKTATFGNTDTTMNVGDIFDLAWVKTGVWEVKGVTFSANATSQKIMYRDSTSTDATLNAEVAANHFYIYNVGAKDVEATYLDLGGLIGLVTAGKIKAIGNQGASKSITSGNPAGSSISIIPDDAATVNLYIGNRATITSDHTLIATITVQ